MNELKPPRLGSWLIAATASTPWNDALAGDLLEEYQRRRSATWYWRQVLTTVGYGVLRDLRNHWLLALRALAVALGSIIILQRFHLATRLLSGTFDIVGLGPYLVIEAALEPFLICAPAGLAVALTHRRNAATMVLVYAASLSIFLICLCANRAQWAPACVLFWESAVFAVVGALLGGFLGCTWALSARSKSKNWANGN